jgi:hypothetical protein
VLLWLATINFSAISAFYRICLKSIMDIQRRNEYKYNVYPLMRVDNKYKNGVNRFAAIKIILVEQISQLEDTYRY